MFARQYDIQQGMKVLFAALLVFAFVTPVCVTMACSMSAMAPATSDMSHSGGMSPAGAGTDTGSNHANHNSLADCMRGFTSYSGLIGTDGLTLAAILIAIALMGLATATAPLAGVSANAWSAPVRAPSPPPQLHPLGVRLSV